MLDWAFWLYYVWALLFVILLIVLWALNFISLPGNWLIVAAATLFALFVHGPDRQGITWTTVGVLCVLGTVGEIIEFVAGAAGAAKQGASRRAIGLSILGAIVGSAMGIGAGLPVPVIGSAVGAIFGGAIGAFVGALLGERWSGKSLPEGIAVGQAAFLGRLLGTVGKLAVGAIMVVIASVDAFF